MKRTFRSVLIAITAGLALAIAASLTHAVKHVADTIYTSCRAFKNLLVDGFMALVLSPEISKAQVVPFVRARAFVLSIIKRDRPVVTSAWRMCPSI